MRSNDLAASLLNDFVDPLTAHTWIPFEWFAFKRIVNFPKSNAPNENIWFVNKGTDRVCSRANILPATQIVSNVELISWPVRDLANVENIQIEY